MRSARPQPVHLLCGRPMVQYVVDSLAEVTLDRIVVVVGEGAEQVSKKISETAADPRIVFAEQARARGNAEATLAGLDVFADDFAEEDLLVLPGNAPLIQPRVVADLLLHHRRSNASATVLAAPAHAAAPFARIEAGKELGSVDRIDEPSCEREDVRQGAAGVYCFRRSLLAAAIRRLRAHPISGSYELAGVVEVLSSAGHRVVSFESDHGADAQPVDDRAQLAGAEAVIRRRTNHSWMRRGVTMVDPDRTYVDTTVRLAPDVTLFPGTMLQGATVVGPGAEIGPDTRLVDCAVGAAARVEKAMGREAEIGENAEVGPFAVLDPGSQVRDHAVTGPFYHATEAT